MTFRTWLQNLRSARALGPDRPRPPRRASAGFNVEHLEDRSVPAQYTITDLGNLGGNYTYAAEVAQVGEGVLGRDAPVFQELHVEPGRSSSWGAGPIQSECTGGAEVL